MLKGKTKIVLRNKKTGALEQETEDENLVTNAAYNLLNVPNIFSKYYENELINPLTLLNPLLKNCFAGLLLFEKNIVEDVNQIFPPANNLNIAHAAGGYSGADSTRGTLNLAESKLINGGRGYRFVWDFATDKANGTIRCACLTSYSGGTIGLNSENINYNDGDKSDLIAGIGQLAVPLVASAANGRSFTILKTETFKHFMGSLENNRYLFCFDSPSAGDTSLRFEIQTLDLKSHLMKNIAIDTEIKTLTSSKKFTHPRHLNCIGDEIQSIKVTGINAFDVILIDPETLEIISEQTILIQDAQFSLGIAATLFFDGYYYLPSTTNGKYYLINALDTSDYSLIDMPEYRVNYDDFLLCVFNEVVMLVRGNRGSENKASYLLCNGAFFKTRLPLRYLRAAGIKVFTYDHIKAPYVLFSNCLYVISSNYATSLSVGVFAPFLSTINNLSTPVIKNETQTMKVTYEITEM